MFTAWRPARNLLLLLLLTFILLLSLQVQSTRATPFQSATPENRIHEPLVVNSSGEPSHSGAPLPSEQYGLPLSWIIVLLILLFFPAGAFVASRRRR